MNETTVLAKKTLVRLKKTTGGDFYEKKNTVFL
jgi:hypothetical protein